MKVCLVFLTYLTGILTLEEKSCYRDVIQACSASYKEDVSNSVNCDASYGAIEKTLPHLQAYVNTHITRSFEYLLTSTHFANYEKSRNGLEKLFRSLSNSKWDDAINLLKHIAKRGGSMNFEQIRPDTVNTNELTYELYELESIAKAVDIEKDLAVEAHRIHEVATRRHLEHYDPEISSYLEEEFVHKHASTIRSLSGHASDLKNLVGSPDNSLALYMFDEYLQGETI